MTRVLPGGDGEASPLARLREATEVDLWPGDEPPPPNALREHAAASDGLVTMLTERVDGALLDAAPRVRAVSNVAVGYDNIDVPACTARGVVVTNTPGVVTEATADMAFTLLLAAARRLPEAERAILEGRWGPWHPTWMLGHEVSGATLGVVGPGRIGRAVAERAHGFRMQVLYYGRHEVPDFPGEYVSLDDLLARSHYVSMHVPLTPETDGMCDDAFFAKMRPDAVFVNTTRGRVVDQVALARALRTGVIGGAALDVTTPEPLPAHDPLLAAPHLVVAPHLGTATRETRTRMAHVAVDGMLAAMRGERPEHAVNPEVFDAPGRASEAMR